jgi:phage tail sheath protein FI
MGFQVSPGVNVTEIDLTTIVPAVSTTDAALVGLFQWGPVEEIVLLGNEIQLVNRFHKPNLETQTSFFTAANFLAYGDKLRLVRVCDVDGTEDFDLNISTDGSGTATFESSVGGEDFLDLRAGAVLDFGGDVATVAEVIDATTVQLYSDFVAAPLSDETVTATVYVGALNATSRGSLTSVVPSVVDSNNGLLIKNDEQYENEYKLGQAEDRGEFAAKYPGALGNSLRVSVCDSPEAFQKTLTGTVAVNGVDDTQIDGTGTAFTTEVTVGSFLIDPVSKQSRQVVSITDDTTLNVVDAFDSALSGTFLNRWEYADDIGIAPGTSEFASDRGSQDDELHVVVVDVKGEITGIAGTVIERHSFLSKARNAKDASGESIFYLERLQRDSNYVLVIDFPNNGAGNYGSVIDQGAPITFDSSIIPSTANLRGGRDANTGSNAITAAKIAGYDLFADAEAVDVALVLAGEANTAVAKHIIENVCEVRKDCIALISPEFADVVNNAGNEADDVIQFRETLPSSSYAVMDSGWKYQFDKYNDTFVWTPLNGDIGGLIVRTDITTEPWYSPAGFNRGSIKGVIQLAWNPFKAQRDDLYLKGINSVVNFSGQGTILYGDKTLLSKPSAFDRINVRRLFIVLEKSISTAAKFTLFEFNDEFTRMQFRNLIEPFLRDVQGRRGIFDFRVVADTTNNTPEVIDRNEFIGDIYIKPARSINFIQLNFIAVRTGVEFSEIVGSF